ncbi:DUF2497 domain-containing protein [Roseococcus pinisoli]|uniref:DUF2497 domain-containing protein n=1 Tax=Roseococcus pinisoli TaxID=2835040 RepID=A0ABS5QCX1_9PROT|nr:DUF2497 domain-containing protein [Roseococcus pinisoli]MBS7811367.1 DUF2497 domain-containing protein [Roseococcus pinisoli]
MDDILASIRKILNEDEAPASPLAPGAEPPIQLTTEMMISAPEQFPAAAPAAALPILEISPAPPAAQPPQTEASFMSLAPEPPASGLVDPLAAAAAASAFGQLSRLAQDRGAAVTRNGPTIEDVVREELRPMLKAWLDAHLPATVERLVRAEIERVMSRQG